MAQVALTDSGRFPGSQDDDSDVNTYHVLTMYNVPGTELNVIPLNSQDNPERWVPLLFLIL